jgi:DNA repair protein RadC
MLPLLESLRSFAAREIAHGCASLEAEGREHARFCANFDRAIARARREGIQDDLTLLQYIEPPLRDEEIEHFVCLAVQGQSLSALHVAGDEDEVSFDRAALVAWLDQVQPDYAFAAHSHPPASSVFPSSDDKRLTRELFRLAPIEDHFVISPSVDDLRFRIFSFAENKSTTLDVLERRELAAARPRRRRR